MGTHEVYIGKWEFNIGQWITHKAEPKPSRVMSRARATNGFEIYGVRAFMTVDPNRDRTILGDSLKPIDDAAWAECLMTKQMAAALA